MTRPELQKILQGFAIPFTNQPKAVNINCPYCVGSSSRQRDDKYRCGIFHLKLRYHCWRCKRTGSLFELLETLVGLTHDEYQRILGNKNQYLEDTPANTIRRKLINKEHDKIKSPETVTLPSSTAIDKITIKTYPLLKKFLYDRKIDVETCWEYEARYTGNAGEFAQRLIIPIYENDRLVAWQGRDITNKSKTKYHTHGNVMQTLYWSTWCENPTRIYLVEGIFDCWRMEYNVVSSFSKSLTRRQRMLLVKDQQISELIICWDSDAYKESVQTARDLAPILDRVGVVRLPDGTDPDTLGSDNVRGLEIRWI